MPVDVLLAMDPQILWAFIVAGLLLNLTPGADVMYVTSASLSGGTRSGIAASIGISLVIRYNEQDIRSLIFLCYGLHSCPKKKRTYHYCKVF